MTPLAKKLSTSLIYSNNTSIERFQWKRRRMTQNKNSWKMKKAFFFLLPSFPFFLFVRSFFRKRDICNFAEKIYLRFFFIFDPNYYSCPSSSILSFEANAGNALILIWLFKDSIKFFQIKIIMSQKSFVFDILDNLFCLPLIIFSSSHNATILKPNLLLSWFM